MIVKVIQRVCGAIAEMTSLTSRVCLVAKTIIGALFGGNSELNIIMPVCLYPSCFDRAAV